MNPKVATIKQLRLFLLAQIEGLTAEQLNEIHRGFNNNIIWNLAHLICAQQSLCYIRSGEPINIDEKYLNAYMTGTKPTGFIPMSEIEEIKLLFISTMDTLQSDLTEGKFEHYTPSPNVLRVYGIELKNLDEALDFLLYHEGYHSGSIMALRHLVS